MSYLDEKVSQFAHRQHGLVTFEQLESFGASPAEVRTRLARGQWQKADRSVVRITGAPYTWETKVLAHVLGAGTGAVASHRTAAALWGMDGFRQGKPEISVPYPAAYRRPGIRTHRSSDLHLNHPAARSGIPVTSVERTLLDLGAVVSPQAVHLALEDARRRRLTGWDALSSTLITHAKRGRRGVGVLCSILDQHFGEVAVTDSGFERLVATAVVQAGLPRPILQHVVSIQGREYRIDLAYPDAMLAIELDGSIHLHRDVWEADHARQNALMLAGWTVLRFTWRDYLDHRSKLVAEVRSALVFAGVL